MPKGVEPTEDKFYRKSIVQALNKALIDYDEPTGGHSERVGGLAGL
ncbi:MAG: hypothetical protein HKL84_06305 [Acidimicrobiaceae bacterium]|nr:hypothetical protein [Acidimicrobiaceae bacterium]